MYFWEMEDLFKEFKKMYDYRMKRTVFEEEQKVFFFIEL